MYEVAATIRAYLSRERVSKYMCCNVNLVLVIELVNITTTTS